jgi:GTP:adenosylcobinamide-phosphate guanylyltransferase
VLIRYLLGWLSLSDALHQLGQRLDLQIKAVMVPFPEAAIDVDSPEDLKLVEEILSRRQKNKHEGA